ncbi:chemotaxis protein CheW [Ohtaekwangia sp.]|uniref:chemotaxis protein CheW n=1 Tax=Ohtaekwangia sp. TaxID=2066019 RepID=UPI002FDDDA9E
MEQIPLVNQSYLTFRLDEEIFAVSVAKVLEILELSKITKVPGTPEFMRGVINLRGNVLPVIDARLKFGMEKIPDTVNTCILVLSLQLGNETISVGALVDTVLEVFEIDETQVQLPPDIGGKYKSEFITGLFKTERDFIMILDMNKILSLEDISILNEHSKA